MAKFFYNETSKEYRPCYKTCKKCSKGGNDEAHNCLECVQGYMFRPGENPHNNCVVYSEFYYIDSYDQYKSMDILQCPEEAKYLVKDKNYCISDCKKEKKNINFYTVVIAYPRVHKKQKMLILYAKKTLINPR